MFESLCFGSVWTVVKDVTYVHHGCDDEWMINHMSYDLETHYQL